MMTHRTILIQRGGQGSSHRLGTIEVRPEGTDPHGYERFHVRLSVLGDSNRASCSCVAESLDGILRDYSSTAGLKETPAERSARLRRETERRTARARRRRYAR
jgi:hypothetical protein